MIREYEIGCSYIIGGEKITKKIIIRAYSLDEALTQFKIESKNKKELEIVSAKPYEIVYTGEQIIAMSKIYNETKERHKDKPWFKKFL